MNIPNNNMSYIFTNSPVIIYIQFHQTWGGKGGGGGKRITHNDVLFIPVEVMNRMCFISTKKTW